ncbi:hypothetical protein QBC36DRAFT_200680 [Triangularia setosa]|uniref:Uncharacterized protein n=1 Tax=Triangularia setosa TaxID=2587417 RepID=A0AAN6VW05_9PEZI|nr:hypothetical protein QBC36DRAFT_200680 [Podospora setosa]
MSSCGVIRLLGHAVYLATWVPRIPESDIQDLWDALESALNGKKASLETPLVIIFATKTE